MSKKPKSHFCQANYPAEYAVWSSMKQRCSNPKHPRYDSYGGRGITVGDRWLTSFHNFMEDMGPRPEGLTLERKDNDKGYSKENCRWATPADQAKNRRSHLRRCLERKQEKSAQLLKELKGGMW